MNRVLRDFAPKFALPRLLLVAALFLGLVATLYGPFRSVETADAAYCYEYINSTSLGNTSGYAYASGVGICDVSYTAYLNVFIENPDVQFVNWDYGGPKTYYYADVDGYACGPVYAVVTFWNTDYSPTGYNC